MQGKLARLSTRGDGPGPSFLFLNGQPLAHTILMHWLKQILASAQIPGKFSIALTLEGSSTIAERNGVSEHLIQSMGAGLAILISSMLRHLLSP